MFLLRLGESSIEYRMSRAIDRYQGRGRRGQLAGSTVVVASFNKLSIGRVETRKGEVQDHHALVHLSPVGLLAYILSYISTDTNRRQTGDTGALYGLIMSAYEPTIRDRVRIALASPRA